MKDRWEWEGKGKGKRKGRPVATETNKIIRTVLRTSGSGDTYYYARSATVVGMGELLLFFGREFTASELCDYFTNARQLVTKRKHPWTNEARNQQTLQHQRLVGNLGLGPNTPQGSADAKEVAAVAKAKRYWGWGKGRERERQASGCTASRGGSAS